MKFAYIHDICDILDNQRIPITSKNRKTGKYPYYGANGIQDYVDDYIFDDELVLLAEDGGNFGVKDKPIAYRVSGKCWVNNHAHVLKPKENILDVDYLCYSLMFYDVSKLINGTTRKKLNQSAMKKIKIQLPPINIQKKISNTLDKLTNLISLRKQQLEKLNLLIKSKFIDMFGDPVINPKKWHIKRLYEISDVRDGTHDSPKYINKGYPLITSKNIANGFVDFTNVNFISKNDYENINKRSKVDVGDIIMPMIGTIGNPIIIDTTMPFAIKNVALIKFIKKDVCNIFIRELLISSYFTFSIKKNKRGGTQKFIALKDIRNLQIPIPPTKLQNQFAEFVEETEKQKILINKSLEKLELLYKSLMQKYFE